MRIFTPSACRNQGILSKTVVLSAYLTPIPLSAIFSTNTDRDILFACPHIESIPLSTDWKNFTVSVYTPTWYPGSGSPIERLLPVLLQCAPCLCRGEYGTLLTLLMALLKLGIISLTSIGSLCYFVSILYTITFVTPSLITYLFSNINIISIDR